MNIRHCLAALAVVLALTTPTLHAQVPNLLSYQGRVAVGTPAVNFEGAGQFKFALVNADGSTTYWSNDGTSTAGSQPTAAVSLTVAKGLYTVLLGDTGMTAIPAGVFGNADVRLRIWFNDGTNGFQLLTPDQRVAPNGYLPDASVTTAKLAAGAVTADRLAPGVGLPPGVVIAYSGTVVPQGWLMCNGVALSRTTYADLFAIIGETHGRGDGSTTFNVPDFRGRFLRGVDANTGRDLDAANRTAMNTGGLTGSNVGTVQDQATRKNGLSLNDPGHSHSEAPLGVRQTFTPSGSASAYINPDSSGLAKSTAATTTGITINNGDTETRPINASVYYLIKY